MAEIQLHGKGQVTLPQAIRADLDLHEGDFLEIEVIHGAILLRPKKLADPDQAYFWSEAWQAAEQKASRDVAAGRTQRFPDAAAAVAHLRAEAAKPPNR